MAHTYKVCMVYDHHTVCFLYRGILAVECQLNAAVVGVECYICTTLILVIRRVPNHSSWTSHRAHDRPSSSDEIPEYSRMLSRQMTNNDTSFHNGDSKAVLTVSRLGFCRQFFPYRLLLGRSLGTFCRRGESMTSSSLAELHNRALRAVRTFSHRGEERIYSLSLRHLAETFSRIHCTLHT